MPAPWMLDDAIHIVAAVFLGLPAILGSLFRALTLSTVTQVFRPSRQPSSSPALSIAVILLLGKRITGEALRSAVALLFQKAFPCKLMQYIVQL